MSMYMTRVELHNANGQDYEVLHEAMARKGFSRKIVANDGLEYDLPTAEYVITGGSGIGSNVLAAAKSAAAQTGRTCWVTVSEAISVNFELRRSTRKAS